MNVNGSLIKILKFDFSYSLIKDGLCAALRAFAAAALESLAGSDAVEVCSIPQATRLCCSAGDSNLVVILFCVFFNIGMFSFLPFSPVTVDT